MTGTSSESMMTVAAAMSVPTSMLPVVSIVTCTMIGQHLAGLGEGAPGAVDGGLDLQGILAGLDQDGVGIALDEAHGLHGEGVLELAIGDVPEARQTRAGTDRADDEAAPAVAREPLDRLVRQLAGATVDLDGAVGEAELAQRDGRAAEGVGLDRVGAGLEIGAVDVAHEVRAGQVQDLGAVLLPPEIVERQVAALDLRAHAAVEENKALTGVVEQVGHETPRGMGCERRTDRSGGGRYRA